MTQHTSRVGAAAVATCLASAVTLGCLLTSACSRSGATRDSATAAVTFSRDVAPIVREHCVACHHPGGAGPFSLIRYEDVRKHASDIVKVTSRRYMPPWPPEPGHVRFAGERRLSDAQIEVFRTWVAQHMVEGDASAVAAPPVFPEGWQLGPPDVVLTMPQAYTLAAEGGDVFRNFVFPVAGVGSRYVRAIEILAGNKRIVHHANIVIDRSGASRRRDEADPAVGFEGMDVEVASDQFEPDSHFLFWKPGTPPTTEPDDMAWRIDRGTDLVLNMHLQPSGKAEHLRPSIGLHFTDRAPTRFPMLLQLEHDGAIDIPPGVRDFEITDSYELPVDVDLIALYPHAHYLGKDLVGTVVLPDKTRQTLIHIADWDLNWQAVYRLASPLFLPRGSVVSMRYRYDNSSANPRNPNEPPRRVMAGNRSSDEMGHLWIQVVPRRRDDLSLLQEALMRQRLRKYPGDYAAHANLGATLQSMGRLDEALVNLTAAAAARPDDAAPANNLGAALLAAGRSGEALEQFRRAVRLAPAFADARYNLGTTLLARGETRAAIEELRQVLAIRPDDAGALNDLGSAMAMRGEVARAAEMFSRAVRIDAGHAYAHYNLAALLAQQGRLREAVEHYETALRLRPGDEDMKRQLESARAALTRPRVRPQ
jgi:Flp pilus assembly protein TadD/mono/diheme cytochrome c family protein